MIFVRREEEEEIKAHEEWERLRRIKPETKQDFSILLHELHSHHDARIKEIRKEKDDDNKSLISTLRDLVDEEAHNILKLDKLRTKTHREQKTDWIQKDLEKMATPLIWSLNGCLSGVLCEVETQETTRAAQILDLYNELSSPVSSSMRRLEVLNRVKDVITGSSDDQLLLDIFELTEREIDMLNRGRSTHMTQLRLRLQNLIKEYIQRTEYNPAAALPNRRVKRSQVVKV
jgi:hypothetical protein